MKDSESERNTASGVKDVAAAQMGYSDTLLSTMAAELSVVTDGEARCARTEEEPQVSCDPATCMRLLFGPLAPSQVIDLPQPAAMLESWCPLPLYWARQDGV